MMFDLDIAKKLGDAHIALKVMSNDPVLVLQGVSGVGKSSVLNMVAGLLQPDAGHIHINDVAFFDKDKAVQLHPAARNIGYVFQDRRIFPHMDVRANLLYGQKSRTARKSPLSFDEIVAALAIAPLLKRLPQDLSGGEAQRVAIGRALLSAPDVLLLDEPLTALDPARREEILQLLLRARAALNCAMIYVSHDAQEAARLGGTIVQLHPSAPR